MKLLKEKLWTDPIKEAGWQVNLQVSGPLRVQANWQVYRQVYRQVHFHVIDRVRWQLEGELI